MYKIHRRTSHGSRRFWFGLGFIYRTTKESSAKASGFFFVNSGNGLEEAVMNQAPVGLENGADRAATSRENPVLFPAPNESFRENGSFYFTPKKYQGKNRTWRSRSESGHCVAWERRCPSSGKLQARIQSCFLWHQRLSRESEAFLFNNYERSISKTSKKYILFW